METKNPDFTDADFIEGSLRNYRRFSETSAKRRTTNVDQLWVITDNLAEALATAQRKLADFAEDERMRAVTEASGLDESEELEIAERPAADRKGAIAAIRVFRNNGALALEYRTTAPNPYKDDDGKRIELYADDQGYEYWVNPDGDTLVQAGPSTGVHPQKKSDAAPKPVASLRGRALQIVKAQCPDLDMSKLHPLEDNHNGEVCFFRWDSFVHPAKESELPPFVQVGLYANGDLASFTNTLV